MESGQIVLLLCAGVGMFAVIGGLSLAAHYYTLNGIKSRTVGDGQHGTARFATEKEIKDTYAHVPYEPEKWRRGESLPAVQGLVVGCRKKGNSVIALVDDGDIHCLMIGAAGVGKTANFLYPNIEYACASGMSWLCTDTKGDLFRNYAGIAKDCYGYNISVLDLRNPTAAVHMEPQAYVSDLVILRGERNLTCQTLRNHVLQHGGIGAAGIECV